MFFNEQQEYQLFTSRIFSKSILNFSGTQLSDEHTFPDTNYNFDDLMFEDINIEPLGKLVKYIQLYSNSVPSQCRF